MYRLQKCIKGGWPLVASLVIISLALGVFAGLAIEVLEQQAIGFDTAILNALFFHATSTLTGIMQVITTSAATEFVVPLLLVLGILWWRRRPADVIALLVAVAGSVMINQIVKALFERARPALHPHLVHAGGYSFPSGHSTSAIALYGMLAYLLARQAPPKRRIWYYVVAGIWILLVGLSRNYLEVHYPSDVLAAYAITLPWLLAVIFVHQCYAPPVVGEEKVIEPAA
jgi:undecaprenyl-diphosphatase